MEGPEPCYGIRYDRRAAAEEGGEEGEEEELTLTPHHTPSQSFDFIVWEKAYLDSIPAASKLHHAAPTVLTPNIDHASPMCVHGPPPPPPPPTTSMCVHRPSAGPSLDPATPSMCVHIGPFDPSLHKETLLPASPSSSTLMAACRTDADLPPSFIDYKPRSSNAGLTSLEEAVRSYALSHPHAANIASTSPTSSGNPEHRSPFAAAAAMSQDAAPPHPINAPNPNVLLRRSYSQPGGGAICRGFCIKPTSRNSSLAAVPGSAVFNGHGGGARIYQEQIYTEPVAVPPVRNRTKMSCFPTSPGRRKRGQSALHDCVDPSTQSAESPTLDVHQCQQEKLRSPAWIFAHSPAAGADAMYMRTSGRQQHPVEVQGMPNSKSLAAARGFSQSSFSDMSSSDCDHHHNRDAAAAALNFSKVKLWRLHHGFKALCRKLCSACTI